MLKGYTNVVLLAQGGQGVTYKATCLYTKTNVCIKKIKKPAFEERRGINLKQRLHHPQIVTTIEVLEDEDYIYHVMNYIEGKSLKHYCHQLSNRMCIHIGCQLIEILDDFRKCHLVYNDLKPDNVILSNQGNVALVDVGAILEVGDLTSKRYGAKMFVAPEYKEGKWVDWKSDLYSLVKVLQYICDKPSPFLKKWMDDASQKKFESLYDAYKALGRLYKNITCFLVCLCCVLGCGFISKLAFQRQSFDFSILQNQYLFHSLDIYDLLSDQEKYQLSNELLNYPNDFMWQMQYRLLQESKEQFLKERFQFLNHQSLQNLDLSTSQLDFYMHYLCHLNNESKYKEAYTHLLEVASTFHQKQWLIEIASRLNDKNALEMCLKKCNGEKQLQALCLYRLFQLGYYQHSYLHQAIVLLEGYEQTLLYKNIKDAIEQWGDLA